MFGIVDVIMFCSITFILTSFVCLFMAGTSINNREGEAYQEGYYKGFADGKGIGETNDV